MKVLVCYCEPSIHHVPHEEQRLSGRELLFASQQGSIHGQAEESLHSPSSHCGRSGSLWFDSRGEKKYIPQVLSGSREVKSIVCEG